MLTSTISARAIGQRALMRASVSASACRQQQQQQQQQRWVCCHANGEKQEVHVHSKVLTPGKAFFEEVADPKSLEDAKVNETVILWPK
jgi:hypothetical protein